MAIKRMFSKEVVCTDKFYMLPSRVQALYFQLGMVADDDGFVSTPRATMRILECNDKDLEALIENGYIMPFKSGVIVIIDWKINNYIQNDRYKPTRYQKELEEFKAKSSLSEKVYTECIQNVSEVKNTIDYDKVIDMYNAICVSLPKVTKITEARKKAIKARLDTYSLEDFERLFTIAESSSFLKGAKDGKWKANFDWLIKSDKMKNVLEGYYFDNSAQTMDRTSKGILAADYGNIEEFEKHIRAN